MRGKSGLFRQRFIKFVWLSLTSLSISSLAYSAHAENRSAPRRNNLAPNQNNAIKASFSGIQKAIVDYEAANPGKTLSIPLILERLPEKFRSGFALMHTSRSAQGATPEFPRVIMFGDDARLVLTFNGLSSQSANNKLELATINEKTGQLEFRFIEFPENDSNLGKAKFSEANPPRCLACHGDAPHFIWGDYAKWPGAYGSQDDVLELGTGELENYKRFLSHAAEHPRYKNLVFEFKELSPNAPYRAYTADDRRSRGSYQLALEVRPNARLSMLLLRQQARSRVAEMISSSDFDKYKFGLAYFLAGCADLGSSGEVERKTGFTSYREFAEKLGSSPNESWHFQLRPESTRYESHYYSGFWTFDSLLSYFLWTNALAHDPQWQRYTIPVGIADALDAISVRAKVFATERGRELYRALDREGRVLKSFRGSSEFSSYVPEAAPDERVLSMHKMCAELAEHQPETR